MKNVWLIVGTACVVVAATSLPAAAGACTKVFTPPGGGTSGPWGNGLNWDPPGEPGSTDRACIQAGFTCHVTDNAAVADSIEVAGTLIIENNATLTIDTDSEVTGLIDISGKIVVNPIVTFSGAKGVIQMTPAGGTPEIFGFAITIDSLVTLSGAGEINANLTNDGKVIADGGELTVGTATTTANGDGTWQAQGGGLLVLDPGQGVTPITGGADWIVEADDANNAISIRSRATSLTGDVTVKNGFFGVTEDFCTTGTLWFAAPSHAPFPTAFSTISVGTGAEAKFRGPCP